MATVAFDELKCSIGNECSAYTQEISLTTENSNLSPAEATRILENLIQETVSGKLRWGFQPPSTAQANRGTTHYVLRLRRRVYRLTARRDGRKQVDWTIELTEPEGGQMTKLFSLATGKTSESV